VNLDAEARATLDEAGRAEGWALPLLQALVETNSHADNAAGLAACHRLLAPRLEALGLATRPMRTSAGALVRDHLLAETPAVAGPTVLLLGHLDTVYPPDEVFPFVVDGPRWRGPGIADMKGGVVTALVTLALLARRGAFTRARFRLLLVSDEEQGSPTGAPALDRAARDASLALAFEAARTCGNLVVARKGQGIATVVVRGASGHAGIDHGRAGNALTALARVVVAAEELEALAPCLTVSPGGAVTVTPAALSCIPDRATCELEWRFYDEAAGARVVDELTARAAAIATSERVTIEVDARIETPPMAPSPASELLVGRYAAAARRLGMDVRGVHTAGVGDINRAARAGATCLDGVGPEGGGFHSRDEFLVIDSIARRAAMNAMALCDHLR